MLNDAAQPTAAPARPVPQARKAAAFPKRAAPLAVTRWCDTCGADQAFLIPGHRGHYECTTCAAERMRHELAQEQLVEALSPIIGMWVAQCRRAGMPFGDIDEIVQHCTGADMAEPYGERHRHKYLRHLGMVYREAAVPAPADPQRVMADPAQLPLIARHLPNPNLEGFSAFLTAGDKEFVHILPGMDAVVLTLEGGVRAVIYMGSEIQAGFRCPPELWPTVAAELKYLPEDAS